MIVAVKEEEITDSCSTLMTRNLLRIAIFNTSYIRGLFPENYFKDTSVPALEMKIKKLLPVDAESRRLIDWMEKGVYDALQKKYLKTLLFCICETSEGSMIEEYAFSFSYSNGDSQEISMYILSGNKKQGGAFKCNSMNEVTPSQMKSSACKMICTLVQLMRTFDKMPEQRTILMKLLYYDDVKPSDYEPPFFKGCTDDSSSYWTKNPLIMEVRDVNSKHFILALKVKSVLDACEDEDRENQEESANLAAVSVTQGGSPASSFERLFGWRSAPVPDPKFMFILNVLVSDELEHRIGIMETSTIRFGKVLSSIQADVVKVIEGTKQLSLGVISLADAEPGPENEVEPESETDSEPESVVEDEGVEPEGNGFLEIDDDWGDGGEDGEVDSEGSSGTSTDIPEGRTIPIEELVNGIFETTAYIALDENSLVGYNSLAYSIFEKFPEIPSFHDTIYRPYLVHIGWPWMPKYWNVRYFDNDDLIIDPYELRFFDFLTRLSRIRMLPRVEGDQIIELKGRHSDDPARRFYLFQPIPKSEITSWNKLKAVIFHYYMDFCSYEPNVEVPENPWPDRRITYLDGLVELVPPLPQQPQEGEDAHPGEEEANWTGFINRLTTVMVQNS